jgi:integration host factor subunit alpha
MSKRKISNSIGRQDISDAVYREIGLSKSESADLVESVIVKISDQLVAGEDVKLAKFGAFVISDKVARPGRNPRTGESVTIAARRVVTFKPSAKLLSRVNSKSKK